MLSILGYIPILKEGKLKVFAILSNKQEEPEGEEKVKLLDDYLSEAPVKFSGLSEFAAVHLGMSTGKRPSSQKNKYDVYPVKIDPEFHLGNITFDKIFSGKSIAVEDIKRKVSFKDIEDFIEWVNKPNETPELLKNFESVDDYVKIMNSALKVLTDKLISDYKFNELVQGINGSEVSGVISMTTNDQGEPESEIKSFSNSEELKTFSSISLSNPDTRQFSRGNLIGTLADFYKYTRFFHWMTRGIPHQAFQSLYESLVEPIDTLAEKCLYEGEINTFNNEVFPKGDAEDYLKRIKTYLLESSKLLFGTRPDAGSYMTLIDDIVNNIDTCLFRLQKK